MVTLEEHANLILYTYEKNPSQGNLDGWQEINIASYPFDFAFEPSDLAIKVFRNGDKIVIAFDGWEPNLPTHDELVNSDSIFFGNNGSYYAQAYYFVSQVIQEVSGLVQDPVFHLVGHSQGGAVAGLMSALFGFDTTTFNAQAASNTLDQTLSEQTFYINNGQISKTRP